MGTCERPAFTSDIRIAVRILLLLKKSWDCTALASGSARQSWRRCRMAGSCSAEPDSSEGLSGTAQNLQSDKEQRLQLDMEHRQLLGTA